MALERTLSIVKPDGVARNLIGEVYRRFETGGPAHRRRAHDAPVAARRPRPSTPCIASGRSTRTSCAT